MSIRAGAHDRMLCDGPNNCPSVFNGHGSDMSDTMGLAHNAGWIVCGINAADARDICPFCQVAHGIKPVPQYARCNDCGERGPAGATTSAANKLARAAGWHDIPHLYPVMLCPVCANNRKRKGENA